MNKTHTDVYWMTPGEVEEAIEMFLSKFHQEKRTMISLMVEDNSNLITMEGSGILLCAVMRPVPPSENEPDASA